MFAVGLNLCLVVESWPFKGDSPVSICFFLENSVVVSNVFSARVRKLAGLRSHLCPQLGMCRRVSHWKKALGLSNKTWQCAGNQTLGRLIYFRVCFVTVDHWIILRLIMECRIRERLKSRKPWESISSRYFKEDSSQKEEQKKQGQDIILHLTWYNLRVTFHLAAS